MSSRKHSLSNDHHQDDLPESSSSSSMQLRRTRPRLDIDHHHDQDLHIDETDLTLYLYVHESQSSQQQQIVLPPPPQQINHNDLNRETELTMYFYVEKQPQPQQQPPVCNNNNNNVINHPIIELPKPQRRVRKKPTNLPRQGKSKTIDPPFAWATENRARVQTLKYLLEKNITKISGDMECKRCQKIYKLEYDLKSKFKEVFEYIENNKNTFFDRAPEKWTHPVLAKCRMCDQENSMKPVISKKRLINWLFLFLGEMVGCCTLEQLKYFCKHTGNHRTGAKDRVLFLAYIELCKQLNSV